MSLVLSQPLALPFDRHPGRRALESFFSDFGFRYDDETVLLEPEFAKQTFSSPEQFRNLLEEIRTFHNIILYLPATWQQQWHRPLPSAFQFKGELFRLRTQFASGATQHCGDLLAAKVPWLESFARSIVFDGAAKAHPGIAALLGLALGRHRERFLTNFGDPAVAFADPATYYFFETLDGKPLGFHKLVNFLEVPRVREAEMTFCLGSPAQNVRMILAGMAADFGRFARELDAYVHLPAQKRLFEKLGFFLQQTLGVYLAPKK